MPWKSVRTGKGHRELSTPGGPWRQLTVLWGCPWALHEDCEQCINSSRHPLEELADGLWHERVNVTLQPLLDPRRSPGKCRPTFPSGPHPGQGKGQGCLMGDSLPPSSHSPFLILPREVARSHAFLLPTALCAGPRGGSYLGGSLYSQWCQGLRGLRLAWGLAEGGDSGDRA